MREDAIKHYVGPSTCHLCQQTLMDDKFPSALDLERSLLIRTQKKLSLRADLILLAVEFLKLGWHLCPEHPAELLVDSIAHVAMDNFLYSWCRRQNVEMQKKESNARLPRNAPIQYQASTRHLKPSKTSQSYGKPNKARKSVTHCDVSIWRCKIEMNRFHFSCVKFHMWSCALGSFPFGSCLNFHHTKILFIHRIIFDKNAVFIGISVLHILSHFSSLLILLRRIL